jgi:hypothetical protein
LSFFFLGVCGCAKFFWGCGRVCGFFWGYLGFLLVYLAQFLVFLTRFFYDNGYDDAGSAADGGIISVIIIISICWFFEPFIFKARLSFRARVFVA